MSASAVGGAIIGFTAWRDASPAALAAGRAAQARVVSRFPRLTTRTLTLGATNTYGGITIVSNFTELTHWANTLDRD